MSDDSRCQTPRELLQHIYGRAGRVAKDQARLREFEVGPDAAERRRFLQTLELFRLLDLVYSNLQEAQA